MTSKNTDELMHLLNETKNCAQQTARLPTTSAITRHSQRPTRVQHERPEAPLTRYAYFLSFVSVAE